MFAVSKEADELEQHRLATRERALRSTYFFGKFVCNFPDLDPDVHGMMSKWVQKPTRFKLGMAPRSHLKSSVWTVADSLRRSTISPESKTLIVNESLQNTIKWITYMQQVVLSEQYRWLFPEVVPDPKLVRWNQTQLELRRRTPQVEPTIEGIGVGGASTSNHYHRVVNDDLVGKEARESPSVMEKAIEQYKLSNSLLVDPSKDSICTWGTRWGPTDLIDWLLKTTVGLDVLHLKVFRPDGSPLWPARFPPHELDRIRLEQGPEMWHLQYLNEALGEGVSEFDPAWLRHWRNVEGDPSRIVMEMSGNRDRVVSLADMTIFQVTDTGLSPESKDARTANLVVGLVDSEIPTEPFQIVILHQRAAKTAPAATVDQSYEVYSMLQPSVWGIEAVGGHQAFFHWILSRWPTARIRTLKTDSHKGKLTRIREAGTFFQQGRVWVHRAHMDFLDEYHAFPNGKTVDLLDCFGYMPQIWFPPDGYGSSATDEDIRGSDLIAEANDEWTGRDPVTNY